MKNLEIDAKKIWDSRSQILEGIKNKIFKSEAVETIAAERNKICETCDLYDSKGDMCLVPGTAPCCGSCGCNLSLKQRSLSSSCPEDYWGPVLTENEEDNHEILNPEQDA